MSDTPSEIVWHRDPAASGWRSRVFMGGQWEILVYDDGDWEVRGPPFGETRAWGHDEVGDAEAAKAKALKVYEALRA